MIFFKAPKSCTDEFQKKSKTPTSLASLTLEDSGDLRADMFVVKATKDGNSVYAEGNFQYFIILFPCTHIKVSVVFSVEVSYNGVFGSRFIQSFVYLMRNLVCEEDFEEIVKKV